jgi:glycerol kinase
VSGCVPLSLILMRLARSTALGSALLAGSAIGLYGWDLSKPETFARVNSQGSSTFTPVMQTESREAGWKLWKQAVEKSKGWDKN